MSKHLHTSIVPVGCSKSRSGLQLSPYALEPEIKICICIVLITSVGCGTVGMEAGCSVPLYLSSQALKFVSASFSSRL